MKQLIAILAVGTLAACGTPQVETVQKTVEVRAFGPESVDHTKAISTKEMLSRFDPAKGEQEFTFEGEINEVCQNAGCWVTINKGGGETFMVRFKDHFTIPTETKSGEKAFIHGVAYMDTIPVEDLQHYAYDAGKSDAEIEKITEPEYELFFEADGIQFRKEEEKKSSSK